MTQSGEIIIWDTASKKQLVVLRGHASQIFSLGWSPDGKRLASAGQDGTVRIWDASRGYMHPWFDPKSGREPGNVALNNAALGRWSEAAAGFSKVVQLGGADRQLWYHLALVRLADDESAGLETTTAFRQSSGASCFSFGSNDFGSVSRVDNMQLGEGEYAGQRIISQARARDMQALQFSIPMLARPKDNIYASQFYGSGLGWAVLDYRGHKILRHGGAWGAAGALVPDKNLCVVVLSNIDLEILADMLTYDLLDAYLAGPQVAWDQAKWESTWLKYEGPGKAYRPRDEAKARLAESRIPNTSPTRPLGEYAATYHSDLYGDIVITHQNGKLLLEFAGFTTALTHWHNDSFYIRSPTRSTYDWFLTFASADANWSASLVVKHIGWDKNEPDHVFSRKQ